MTAADHFLQRVERRAGWSAAALAAAALVLGPFEVPWIAAAYRLAAFTCLAPAAGSLVLVLIHRVTGGQWTAGLGRFLGRGVAALPWIWLLALPALLLPWPAASGHRHLPLTLGYDGLPMVALRAAVVAALFFVLRSWLADGPGALRDPRSNRRPWVGPAGLIMVFFIFTFVGDDWLESLEAGWHSTAFPVIWIASQVVSGLALALLCGLGAGARPDVDGAAGRTLGIDWGNLLLATMMFWTYVTFAQFLIIWPGNLPEEISWYVRREQGGWKWIVPAVALGGFAVPFFLLLSRRLKRSATGLSLVAGLLLATQWLYLFWTIAPAGGSPSLPALLLLLAAAGAAAALFVNRYARGARLAKGEAP